jgi:hypothetical protein
MTCPDLGALRASLDADSGGAAPAVPPDHLRTCPSCADTLAELQRTAELAAPAIALTAPDQPPDADEVEAALARFERRRARLAAATTTQATASAAGQAPVPVASARPGRRARLSARTRAAAAALAAALALTVLVATPAGRAAAGGFLAQFRSQRFEVVSIDPAQSTRLEDVVGELEETGVFTGASQFEAFGEPQVVADRAQASRLAGFAVPVVDPATLPGGVERDPERILVSRAREIRLTFDRDRALDYLRRNGRPAARLPERYDGTQLVIQLPAAIVQQFAGRDGGPALLVAKAGMLGLDAEGGASLEELREVVLDLPGLPAETVAQLRAIGDWRNTLPLPVPTDEVRWRPTMVEGTEAISFADQTGRLHALLWQRGGHVWGVAGVLGADEARGVASSLG